MKYFILIGNFKPGRPEGPAFKAALDAHHASPMMAEIAALREKYDLRMTVERFISDEGGVPESDQAFIREENH